MALDPPSDVGFDLGSGGKTRGSGACALGDGLCHVPLSTTSACLVQIRGETPDGTGTAGDDDLCRCEHPADRLRTTAEVEVLALCAGVSAPVAMMAQRDPLVASDGYVQVGRTIAFRHGVECGSGAVSREHL